MMEDKGKETVRCFIALELCAVHQKELWRQCRKWRESYNRFRWGTPDNYHLTLAFLGDQPPEVLTAVTHQLHRTLASVTETTFSIDQLQLFPPRRPHVVAASVVPSPALNLLYRNVIQACMACGIELTRSSRSFHPHITVARFRPQTFRDKPDPLPLNLTLPLAAVVLYSSELRREGAIHRVMERFTLQRG